MMAAAGMRESAAPAQHDEQVIDVATLGPALLPSSPPRRRSDPPDPREEGGEAALPARRGSRSLSLTRPNVSRSDSDSDLQSEGPETEGEDTPHEHQYRRGRQQVPMQSPGDEADIDLQLDEDGDRASGSTLRSRVFFQSDEMPRSYRYRSSGGVLQRITLRRRRRNSSKKHEWFWTAISLTTVLSLALLSAVVVYLSQTDFFASHQTDLLGTTVENRFTVVSRQDSSAKIYLKSGYSKSQLSEAMISFTEGELRLGRRALEASEPQSFFGLSIFTNGTSVFSNKVEAPTIATEYLHASKAVVFEDGTVMTTAANMSGGVKEVGDLNLVSQSGSVVTSAGGKPLLVVLPEGSVVVADADAEDPTASGITLSGAQGLISIGDGFSIRHDGNTSTVSTSSALHLNSSHVLFSDPKGGKVRLTIADTTEDNEATATDRRALGGEGATDGQGESVDGESVTLEVVGQSSSNRKEGGDIRISGGDGLEVGGDVVLVGGESTDMTPTEFGTISINANLDEESVSLTEIGSHSKTHAVNLHGLISMNRRHAGVVENSTVVHVGGGLFNVSTQRITLNNSAISGSKLRLDSKSLLIGTMTTPLVTVGKLDHSDVSIQGSDVSLDATGDVTVGNSASSISIGKSKVSGQTVDIASELIKLEASKGVSISPTSAGAKTTIAGAVDFTGDKKAATSLLGVAGTVVSLNAPTVSVGAAGKTLTVDIEATKVSIGEAEVNGSFVAGKVEITSTTIEIGSEDSSVSVQGASVNIDAEKNLVVGEESTSISIGSDSGAVSVTGKSVVLSGSSVHIGRNLTAEVTIGSAAVKKAELLAQSVTIGSDAATVSIGVKSKTIEIGSADTDIKLTGHVTLNGETLESRRRLETVSGLRQFGYFDADKVSTAAPAGSSEFAIAFDSGYVSDPDTYKLNSATERFLSVAAVDSGDTKMHSRLSLDVAQMRLVVSSETLNRQATSKISCSVNRHTEAGTTVSALRLTGHIEHCSGLACEEDIFLGMSAHRVVSYTSGDSFSVRCRLVASVAGELLMDGVQYSFSEL